MEIAMVVSSKDIEMISDRKSTRLNSSHTVISYAVFCLRQEEHTGELQSHSELRRQRVDLVDAEQIGRRRHGAGGEQRPGLRGEGQTAALQRHVGLRPHA